MQEGNCPFQPLLAGGSSSSNSQSSSPPDTPIPTRARHPRGRERERYDSEFTSTLSKLDAEPSTLKARVTAMTQTFQSQSMTSMNLVNSLNSFTHASLSSNNPIIASLSPPSNDGDGDGDRERDPLTNSKLLDVNMTVNLQKSLTAINTSNITEDESQFYHTDGGGKIYIDPSCIPDQFRSNNGSKQRDIDIVDLRKDSSLSNQMMIEMDPSWTPFEHYRCDLVFIALSILVDLFAITMTWLIFVIKDDFGNEHYYEVMLGNDDIAIPYPTGYELLRCLFIPLLVYTVNRILHFVISKSVKYLYFHGEKTLFITLRNIEDCNRHFVDIAMVLLFGAYIYVICSYWFNLNRDHHQIVYDHHGLDEWINTYIWLHTDWLDTKPITFFMLAVFMIIYCFDIYCSLHYGFIYIRYKNYAQYNTVGARMSQKKKKKNNRNQSKEKEVTTTKNLQNHTLNETEVTVHVTSFQQKAFKRASADGDHEQTASLISRDSNYNKMDSDHNLNDLNYKEYNPHDDDDIATLKIRRDRSSGVRRFKKRNERNEIKESDPTSNSNSEHSAFSNLSTLTMIHRNGTDLNEFGSRHYSLYGSVKGGEGDNHPFRAEHLRHLTPRSHRAHRRLRSLSESDLMTTRMIQGTDREQSTFTERVRFARNQSIASGVSTATISPIRPIRKESRSGSNTVATTRMHTRPWWERGGDVGNGNGNDDDIDEHKASMIMELREKVNFLKATLFAKQSIIDQMKLESNEQSYIISNLSQKVKRMEQEKDGMEQELMERNDELEEKRILLQVAEDTQTQITKECDRLTRKLRSMTKHSRSEQYSFTGSHSRSGLRTPSRQ